MPVRELQERITSAEFTEIAAYLRMEPRGYGTENWRTGMLAATVANSSGRYARRMKPADFFPPKQKKLKLTKAQEQALKRLQRDGNSKRRDSSG